MTMTPVTPAGDAIPAVRELQGFNIELLAGTTANTKIDVAAIRSDDTVIKALNNDAGTITDITDTISIVDLRATGTLTLDTVIATDVATVQGVTYTFSASGGTAHTAVALGEDDTESAANLAAAINANECGPGGANRFFATSALGVVTITARAEGTAGNAYTIASVDSTITASAGTLAGGSATGGIKSTGATDQVLLFWFNKG